MQKGYKDVEKQILSRIEKGDLKIGDRVGPMRPLAKELGVSLVTVDRALRELTLKGVLTRDPRKGIFVASPDLCIKGKIHAVLKTLDGKTPFSDLLNGMINEAWPRGYQVSVSCTNGDTNMCLQAVQRALLEPADGILYMAGGNVTNFEKNTIPLKMLLDRAIPVVIVGHCKLPGMENVPSVSSAHEQAGYDMARHLLSKNLRNLAILGLQPHQAEQAIVAGCQRAFQEAGVRLRPNWIRFHSETESIAPDIQYLLNTGKRPDAIFALTDLVAGEAMLECERAGISVPDEIKIVGFGDYPIGRLVKPALTTVRVNLHAVGSIAANALIRQIEGMGSENTHTQVPCQLVIRESCGL